MKKNIRIWVTFKRVTKKIRSLRSPLIKDDERRLIIGVFKGIWIGLGFGIFGRKLSRRGVHVKPPERGSRDGIKCFGGIRGSYAVLRREFDWGNLDLLFFGVLGGCPREVVEEGGPLCVPFVRLGELSCALLGWTYGLRTCAREEPRVTLRGLE
jgi:hypothetical protein